MTHPRRDTTSGLLAALSALALVSGAARAADTTPAEPPPAPAAPAAAPAAPAVSLGATQAHLKAQRWAQAIDELKRVNAPGNADWNNLMGYALRKQAQPDLAGAQRHYDAALRLNPNHLGALEYAGELALMKKDLPAAEAYLARLQKLCKSPCEPLDDLTAAVTKARAKPR
jgi:tetratricopeptide (TPR) repeat protein